MTDPQDQKLRDLLAWQEEERKNQLPHLHSFPWYPWAREFYEGRHKKSLLCAANQISKSTTQIRKCINWAVETSLWKELWPASRTKPNQFWYLYPSSKVLNAEFLTKWLPMLPQGEMKDDAKYGWKEIRDKGDLIGIKFNSGLYLFFKFYSQKVADLQSGSVYAIFCDEELPMHLYNELINRLNATDGYFHMVFTATIGQDFWRRALEPGDHEKEELEDAWKRQVSLYDSMYYEDGSPSQWTEARISQVKANCESHNEVLRRVFGKFVMAVGRKYHAFDASKHMKKKHPIPKEWIIYSAVDPGSGGVAGPERSEAGHPAAMCFVAVRPDYRQGRVIAGWRGDGIETENSATVRKFREIKLDKGLQPVEQRYDWANKDFEIVARGMGETFIPAEKSHEKGEATVNTLFKNDMLAIHEDEELAKLAGELSSLRKGQNKKHALDDFSDTLRYCVVTIPWDFAGIVTEIPELSVRKEEPKLSPYQQQIKERREHMNEQQEEGHQSIEDELDEWNEAAGGN